MDDNRSFEKKLKRLEEIVTILEKEEKPLNETVVLFKEGINLSKECRQVLDNIEQKISEVAVSDDKIILKKVESDE